MSSTPKIEHKKAHTLTVAVAETAVTQRAKKYGKTQKKKKLKCATKKTATVTKKRPERKNNNNNSTHDTIENKTTTYYLIHTERMRETERAKRQF